MCCIAFPSICIPADDSASSLSEARALEDKGLSKEAAQQYEALLRESPHSREAQLGLGRSLANQGDCSGAAAALHELLPSSSEAEALVGVCHFRLHQFDLAISHLQRAVHLAPAAKDPLIFLGRSYAGQGRNDQAIATLKAWLTRHGDDPDVLYWIGKFYEGEAEATFEKMAQDYPNSYVVYEVEGEGDLDRREYAKAVTVFQHALALAPDAPGLHFWLGSAYWHLRSLDKAQPELEKELQANPSHAQANYQLGDIYVSMRDPAKAIPFLENAVRLNPSLWDAHRSLGRALVMQNKFAEGIVQFQMVANAFPLDDSIHGLLSNAYRRMGNMPKAEEEGNLFQKLSAERLARVHKPSTEEPPAPDSQQ